ncbi:bifunctional response regulator/alkaline phosphatase family protein [Cytophagaceae bacterium DM2B3-1]|uniref:Bifunctional response regulator/alkaline phosphatase family protein n=1 Tax=Xanthocytophaga flava TaxID=3048013 RepID=A0ABT7CPV6_9BACT|nr:bifunctional response regulator/alkaline phosphatase family protein [Xanthocytophaga flavus]MDJ1495783.1 bifunctional response regulator/alkaline phosphatase family protein [Xanthocytophaga flavus]
MQRYSILWADDEIDLLKPHILFLENKGYDVTPVNSGSDALDKCQEQNYDIVFLDENMPGMTGLETLTQIKTTKPNLPVVMITKSEEEHIMEEAIGSKIADYLIKPLNPNQILLSVKKILDNKRLVSEKTNQGYLQDFRNISMAYMDRIDHNEWVDIYKKLIYWELEMDSSENKSMGEVLDNQKSEANTNFVKFIIDSYEDWLNDPKVEKPLMSHQLMKKKVFPLLGDEPVFFFLIDNLRYDQWKVIEPILAEYFNVEEESTYYSILPTTTAFARNSIFSGMLPSDMEKYHSDLWVNDDDDEGKNNHEEEFLKRQLQKNRIDGKVSYHKIINVSQGKTLDENLHNLMTNQLNVIVYNFVDMLSHARTDMAMVRELAPDESAYRSITRSWLLHSPLIEMFRKLAERKVKVIVTTDHGTVRVKRPFKIVGDRNVNTNLRYKQGKNLGFDDKDVFVVRKPERFFLPKINVSTAYVFAIEDYFFAYPNNYNYYVNYYKDTFQHGGVSLEEMIIPYIQLSPKQ